MPPRSSTWIGSSAPARPHRSRRQQPETLLENLTGGPGVEENSSVCLLVSWPSCKTLSTNRPFMKRIVLISVALTVAACSKSEPPPAAAAAPASAAAPAAITKMPKFDAAPLLDHIKALSSDEFEGRKPGTNGEDLTVTYLEDAFKTLGLKPGNTDGTYIQKVPMVGITATNTTPLTISKGGTRR